MVTLTSEPVVTVAAKVSRWNAAFNPVRFKFQREVGDVRDNLRLEMIITSGTRTISGYFSPGPDGLITANVYALLKSFIRPVDGYDHVSPFYIDRNLFAAYTVKYREEWEDANRDTQNSAWVTLPNTYYVTYTAMQLGEAYGGNMFNYLTFLGGSAAKFLTEFDKPYAWPELPFDISFIIGETLLNKPIIARFTPLDVNGGPAVAYLLTEQGIIMVDENGGAIHLEANITPQTYSFSDVGLARVSVPDRFADVQQLKLDVFYLEGSAEVKITEDKYFNIQPHCPERFIYLKWLNHYGAWDYFRFGFNQTTWSEVSNDTIVNRIVNDWENDQTIADVTMKAAQDRISAGADGLNKDQLRGLTWLKKSIKAQLLVGSKWQTVIVAAGSTDNVQSRKSAGTIKITISLPETNIQNQ